MKFGIFSNGLRTQKIAAVSYESDLAEIVAADRLGFHEAWVSEHMGAWLPDCVPLADLLIARAAGVTKRIKLGPAVRLLPLFHPIDVAAGAAACDHLLRGRYLFGFGTGVPFLGNMQRRGMTNEARFPMVQESIAFIRKCWSAEQPFDWNGKYWRGIDITVFPKPYQRPHPPIAVASGQTAMLQMAAENGWTMMVSQFDPPETILARGNVYVAAAVAAGAKPDRSKITVSRHIHVSDSVNKARNEMRADVGQSLEEWKRKNPERFRGYMPASGKVEDINYDQAFDSGLFIGGDPDTVVAQLKDCYRRAGGFGTLLIVMGKDWGTAKCRTRSMKLFMEEVAPRLARLDANRAKQPGGAAVPDNPGSAHRTAAAY